MKVNLFFFFFIEINILNVVIWTLQNPSILILFGMEYLLLSASLFGITCKYILNIIDLRTEGRWEDKVIFII